MDTGQSKQGERTQGIECESALGPDWGRFNALAGESGGTKRTESNRDGLIRLRRTEEAEGTEC